MQHIVPMQHTDVGDAVAHSLRRRMQGTPAWDGLKAVKEGLAWGTFDYVTPMHLMRWALVVVCTVVSYALNHRTGLGPIVGATITCMLIGLVSLKYAAAGAAGAFGGMASVAVIPSFAWAAVMGVFIALVFEIFVRLTLFTGWGGRLGCIAVIGCTVTNIVHLGSSGKWGDQKFFSASPYKWVPWAQMMHNHNSTYWYQDNSTHITDGLTVVSFITPVLATPVAAFLTIWLRCNLPLTMSNPVIASAFTGLIGFILFNDLPGGGPGEDATWFSQDMARTTGAWYTGGFLGMATAQRIPNYGAFVVAGIITGLVYISLYGLMIDFGGRLGAAAFLGTTIFQLFLPWWPQCQEVDEAALHEEHKIEASDESSSMYEDQRNKAGVIDQAQSISALLVPKDVDNCADLALDANTKTTPETAVKSPIGAGLARRSADSGDMGKTSADTVFRASAPPMLLLSSWGRAYRTSRARKGLAPHRVGYDRHAEQGPSAAAHHRAISLWLGGIDPFAEYLPEAANRDLFRVRIPQPLPLDTDSVTLQRYEMQQCRCLQVTRRRFEVHGSLRSAVGGRFHLYEDEILPLLRQRGLLRAHQRRAPPATSDSSAADATCAPRPTTTPRPSSHTLPHMHNDKGS